ncbi:hypothetical protein GCM10028773_59470 [Spirosoma koreense]
MTTAKAQDVSINVLSTPATLPLYGTSSIQVDICNTDPGNVTAPVGKLNPQISVGSNVTILGVTTLDGSPLTDFTILANSGKTMTLSNAVALSNSNCSSFLITVQGDILDTPGNAGIVTATLGFQGAVTAGNQDFNDNSTTSIVVAAPKTDLTAAIFARPSTVNGVAPVSVVVDVFELNSVATNGTITIKISRDSKLNLSFNPAEISIGGRPVQNSLWDFDSSQPSYYVLTSKQPMAAGGQMSIGLNGTLNPGATVGIMTISSIVVGDQGEQELTNNAVVNKVEYFNQ